MSEVLPQMDSEQPVPAPTTPAPPPPTSTPTPTPAPRPIPLNQNTSKFFAPNGQLYQVQYALKAVANKGYTALGISTDDGVVLASQKKIDYRSMDPSGVTNLYSLCDHIGSVMVGEECDCRFVAAKARHITHHFRFSYGYAMPVQTLTKRIADVTHLNTMKTDLRVLNCSLLLGCVDDYKGPIIMKTDPSADFWGYNAYAIGCKADKINQMLKEDYNREMTLDDTIRLALFCLKSVSNKDAYIDNFEVGILTMDNKYFRVLREVELCKYFD